MYVSALGEHLITKDMLTVRVGLKETADPTPLCYCLGTVAKAIKQALALKEQGLL